MGTYDGAIASYGAGVNSTAMVVRLVSEGWRGPVVFCDTGAEWPETMCYVRLFNAWLRERGLEVTTLKGMPWQRLGQGLSLIERCEKQGIIPLAAVRWCTSEYKVKPLQRYAEGRPQLIGIAAEEAHRARDAVYPLLDWGIDREGCRRIIAEAGLDQPQKSGCYICPFQRKSQWFELWRNHSELYERAARIEEIASERTGRRVALDPAGKVTLRQLALGFSTQGMLFDDAEWDDLRRYQPCMCAIE